MEPAGSEPSILSMITLPDPVHETSPVEFTEVKALGGLARFHEQAPSIVAQMPVATIMLASTWDV